MSKELELEGLKPISKATHDALDAEAKAHWQHVEHSNPPTFIPKGFKLVTARKNRLHGLAVPNKSHCGNQTGTKGTDC